MEQKANISKEDAISLMWYRGHLGFKLHSGQKLIYDRLKVLPKDARQVVFLCGRRYGKSYLTLCIAIEECLRKSNSRILFCAPTKLQCSEITVPLMTRLIADAPEGLIKRHKSSHRWNFINGSTLILNGFDLVAESIRGSEFDNIYLEESGATDPNDFLYTIKSILFPTLLKSRGKILHVTTLPRIEDHPFIIETLPSVDLKNALFKFPLTECPLYTKEELDEMCCEMGGPDSIDWKREALNIQVRDGRLVVIPEFDYDIVRDFTTPSHYKSWLSGDWGGVRDKTAFLLMAYDFERAKVLVLDERVFSKHTLTSDIVASVKDMELQWNVKPARYVDCSGQLQVDLMGTPLKFPVNIPIKDEFEASINFIRMNIKNLEIHPRCAELIYTLNYARLNKQRTDFERTEVIGHADALMALCYGLRYINRNNPFPDAALNTHLGSHYVPVIYDTNKKNSKSAQSLKSLFKV